jgi:ribulose-5-phosphate 4-epimerase/fuculose-1-phosphate aldolase
MEWSAKMSEKEGVIKFKYDLHYSDSAVRPADVSEIDAGRSTLFDMGGIGVDRTGIGYGNISRLISRKNGKSTFLITGSQTGGFARLTEKHYTIIDEYDISKFYVRARGMVAPSSESLTHAMLYDLSDEVRWIAHIHDEVIWEYMVRNNLPSTDESAYGTSELAMCVKNIYNGMDPFSSNAFAMLGHRPGIVSFGRDMGEAINPILMYLRDAIIESFDDF